MNKIFLVTLLAVLAIAIFVVGGGVGVFYQKSQQPLASLPAEKTPNLINELKKSVVSITAYGQVSDIQGKSITLTNNNATLALPVAEDAQIYIFTPASGKTPAAQSSSSFDKIKKGDYVNVDIRFSQNNALEGSSVVILPIK